MSSGNLALQGVTRHLAGNYTCIASNVEGDGESNTVHLKVMCKYFYFKFLFNIFSHAQREMNIQNELYT